VRDAHRHESRLPLTESTKPTLLQALGDKRIVAVLLMSFASGLPFNLSGSGFAFQAWLASEGVNLKAIVAVGLWSSRRAWRWPSA
jgi:hypothetical protein